MARRSYSFGALAKPAGVAVPTVRDYGEIGLLPAAGRRPGGHRFYSEDHLKRLRFIRRGRERGFSQEDVRALLANADRQDAPCEAVDRLARVHLAEVRAKIASLQALERALEQMIAACRDDRIASCSIIDALSDLPVDVAGS